MNEKIGLEEQSLSKYCVTLICLIKTFFHEVNCYYLRI